MTLDLNKIKAAAMVSNGEPMLIPATEVSELIARLEAAQNSDQHNFDRWQACQEKLEAVLELITRLEELQELYASSAFNTNYWKAKAEAAEKDAAKYQELIYAVGRKFPNETRHETALKYIHQMEEPSKTAAMKESEK